MKQLHILFLASIVVLLSACGDSNNNNSDRFTQVTKSGDTLEVDSTAKLEWIGSAGEGACSPHGAVTTEASDVASAKAHCDTLMFAGHSDWRVPTSMEHQAHIVGMKDAGMTPFYLNPSCPRVIGVSGTSATAVNTHNSDPIGGMTSWSALAQMSPNNFGIKCVRDQ